MQHLAKPRCAATYCLLLNSAIVRTVGTLRCALSKDATISAHIEVHMRAQADWRQQAKFASRCKALCARPLSPLPVKYEYIARWWHGLEKLTSVSCAVSMVDAAISLLQRDVRHSFRV